MGHGEPAMIPWHPVQCRAAHLRNRCQDRGGIEHFAREYHGRARAYAGENRQNHSEAMIERHWNAEPIRLAEIQCLSDKPRIIHHVMVRERSALRAAGGAACELDIDRVVAVKGLLSN